MQGNVVVTGKDAQTQAAMFAVTIK